jgi:hypothetical protein
MNQFPTYIEFINESWKIPFKMKEDITYDEKIKINIPIVNLTTSVFVMNKIMKDIHSNKKSKTDGPILLFFNKINNEFLIEDGYHRVAETILKKQLEIDAFVYNILNTNINIFKRRIDLSPIINKYDFSLALNKNYIYQ